MAAVGGPSGKRAALTCVAAIGVTSAVVNLGVKPLARRNRPDRTDAEHEARHVLMPESTSFPSGHSASAFAFAEAVSSTLPVLGVPLRLAAATVAYSRVHTGVHYPGDVIVGSLIGMTAGQLVAVAAQRVAPPGLR
jgi:undecaprenyl-diphosphatase